jgi:hypothetical protein
MYIMAGLLLVGFVANLLVRLVDPKYHFQGSSGPTRSSTVTPATLTSQGDWERFMKDTQPDYDQKPVARLVISWAVVGIPLLWAIYQTLLKSLALFN